MTGIFFHRTNNIKPILESGRVRSLKHLARVEPALKVSIESSMPGSNLGGLLSNRTEMNADDAYENLKDTSKDVDNVFLTKDTLAPESYGKYVIKKRLKNPKFNTDLNLISNEYKTPRSISVRSRADIYVPDEEHDDMRSEYPSLNIDKISNLEAPKVTLADRVRTLYSKITKKASMSDLMNGTEQDIKKLISPNALIVGSEGIGIDLPGASDRDILVPYKTRKGYDRLVNKLKEDGFGLQESEYNARKRDGFKVYSYKDDEHDVDVALVHGGKAPALADHIRHLRETMTDEERNAIKKEKERLQNAWFFKDYRYKRYKRGVDKDLGLTKFHE